MSGQTQVALTIYQNTGGNFNAPPITTAQPIGTATLSFDSCTSGELTYNLDGSRVDHSLDPFDAERDLLGDARHPPLS